MGGAAAEASMPITVRVREACRLTGIGRSKMYMLIQEGHIEVVKVGSMTLITMRSLTAFLLPPPRP
ncbi:helix-turn-helix domain-containing protein [Sphingosinicella sp. BN140058]|uniref:helix-turn-helix domain-containing protein n=1 Tax=Sphingosinicella sp. BN140058 TaxID=1892855 RepID=UPI001011BA29|nr:helix-turn-helix domain-containing protein [Sphingosinicella sp. BN140058]QAY78182.1 DNA-binding protein [Sphingosinicella sp. BN140058]